ncbi:DUF368 domain-containing protein [Peptostreptococcus canis]|nr:DUF368 domain-containing protein [Peptostreptococcus canis]
MNLFNGFCMALADSVPGVSGGTIAFILGFYEQLLEAINCVTTRDKSKMKESVYFLVKLALGWIIGITLSVSFLSRMFEKNIYFMSSLFIGLTSSSVVYIIKNEYNKIEKKKTYLIYTFLGVVIVVAISFLRKKIGSQGVIDMSNLDFFEYAYLFFSGMTAISAMVLPGISGSTVLLIFGVYIPLINSIESLLLSRYSVLCGIIIFALGVLFGLVSSVQIIRRAFVKYRSKMIHFIVGLTIGSIYPIANGPTTLEKSSEALNLSNFDILGFSTGILLLLILGYISRRNKSIVRDKNGEVI